MKNIVNATIIAGLTMLLFSGCGSEESVDTGGSSGGTDNLTLSKTSEGFLVTWTKKSSGYGEVVFNDGNYGRTLITTNSKATIFSTCKKVSANSYNCKASNLSDSSHNYKSVNFTEGTQYQWYTTVGTNHVKGEVEAVTESNDGILTIN